MLPLRDFDNPISLSIAPSNWFLARRRQALCPDFHYFSVGRGGVTWRC